MWDEVLIEQLNRGCVRPPDAGSAWPATTGHGIDRSRVEDALRMTPEQRLDQHQRTVNLRLEIEAARVLE